MNIHLIDLLVECGLSQQDQMTYNNPKYLNHVHGEHLFGFMNDHIGLDRRIHKDLIITRLENSIAFTISTQIAFESVGQLIEKEVYISMVGRTLSDLCEDEKSKIKQIIREFVEL